MLGFVDDENCMHTVGCYLSTVMRTLCHGLSLAAEATKPNANAAAHAVDDGRMRCRPALSKRLSFALVFATCDNMMSPIRCIGLPQPLALNLYLYLDL